MNTSELISVASETETEFLVVGTKILIGITYYDAAGDVVEGGSRSVLVRYTVPLQDPASVVGDETKKAGGTDTVTVTGIKWVEFDLHGPVRRVLLSALLAGEADPVGATHYRLTVQA